MLTAYILREAVMNYYQLFDDPDCISFLDDGFLALLDQTLNFMNVEELTSYIQRVKRFNWSRRLKRDLTNFPDFYQAMQSHDIKNEQATQLLFKFADTMKHDNIGIRDQITSTTTILKNSKDRDFQFKEAMPAFEKTVESLGASGDFNKDLLTIAVFIKAGLTPEQSMEIVNDTHAKSNMGHYALYGLYDEVDVLGANNIDGPNLYKLFKVMMGDNPYHSSGNFNHLVQLLDVIATNSTISPADAVTRILAPFENDQLPEAETSEQPTLSDIFVSQLNSGIQKNSEPVAFHYIKDVDSYFPDLPVKKLMTGILPYRLQKDLVSGIGDLKELMETQNQEGSFIFDPEKEIWYSLGGRTSYLMGANNIRHEFAPYDVAKLSQNPVMIHMHPRFGEVFISPSPHYMKYPVLQEKWTAYRIALPSSADYNMCAEFIENASSSVQLSSFIVTPVGLTEMKMPNDPHAIKQVGLEFLEQKDHLFDNFKSWHYIQTGQHQKENALDFVQHLLPDINNGLPEDFQINIYPYQDFLKQPG
ncbi:MAG TPA: hypothetical protein VGF14_02455 [Alphaproteobacteria bacterium]